MLKTLLLIAAACLVLPACQTVQIDAAIEKNLPKVCSAAATAHSAFVVVAATGNLKAKTIAKEAVAWRALEVVCDDPQGVTTANALVKAAEAYAVITIALREAKEA
ncbi:cell wall anchor protein [Rhizobium sp. Leaf384]|uniref:cell wall anchor protein n=1 Tax=Rhizobium sp. Leaf384 TaxID=1736358 RepID=UPI000AB05D91|nr:cell wall anchor protein [Rhizobium sp. Leaf384]